MAERAVAITEAICKKVDNDVPGGRVIKVYCDNGLCFMAGEEVVCVVTSDHGSYIPEPAEWTCPSCGDGSLSVAGRDIVEHQFEKWREAIRTTNALLGQRE